MSDVVEYLLDDTVPGHRLVMRVYPAGRAPAAYRAVCGCATYSTRRYAQPRKAEAAARDHLRSKRP